MFKEFDITKYYKKNPPANGSFTTMQEIKELKKIPINKKFIKDKDNTLETFKPYIFAHYLLSSETYSK